MATQVDSRKIAEPSQKPTKVLWLQVAAIAGIQGAIVLSWGIYNLYLTILLGSLGFSTQFAATVVLIANLAAAIAEPIVGSLADLCQRGLGSRFLVIAVGAVLSGALFMVLPTLLILGNLGQTLPILRALMPMVLVAWVFAITLVRSPALSLLQGYALKRRLPQAASLLTLMEGMARSFGFLASSWLVGIGPVFAFGMGALSLIVGTVGLILVNPDEQVEKRISKPPIPQPFADGPSPQGLDVSSMSLIFPKRERTGLKEQEKQPLLRGTKLAYLLATGIGVSVGFRLLLITFSRILGTLSLPSNQVNGILGIWFLSLGIMAIPMGNLGVRWGNRRALLMGLTTMAGLCVMVLFTVTPGLAVLLALVLGAAFSLVANGVIPFALSLVPPEWSSLGMGVYFSGTAIAAALLTGHLIQIQDFHPAVGCLLGAGSFLLAGFFVASASTPAKEGSTPKASIPQ